jgi:hypothetical protein
VFQTKLFKKKRRGSPQRRDEVLHKEEKRFSTKKRRGSPQFSHFYSSPPYR